MFHFFAHQEIRFRGNATYRIYRRRFTGRFKQVSVTVVVHRAVRPAGGILRECDAACIFRSVRLLYDTYFVASSSYSSHCISSADGNCFCLHQRFWMLLACLRSLLDSPHPAHRGCCDIFLTIAVCFREAF